MKLLGFAALTMLLAAPAIAQPSGSSTMGSGSDIATGQSNTPEGPSEAGTGANGERRVCRRVETGSSSRMQTRRVCLTPAEWRVRDASN